MQNEAKGIIRSTAAWYWQIEKKASSYTPLHPVFHQGQDTGTVVYIFGSF